MTKAVFIILGLQQ